MVWKSAHSANLCLTLAKSFSTSHSHSHLHFRCSWCVYDSSWIWYLTSFWSLIYRDAEVMRLKQQKALEKKEAVSSNAWYLPASVYWCTHSLSIFPYFPDTKLASENLISGNSPTIMTTKIFMKKTKKVDNRKRISLLPSINPYECYEWILNEPSTHLYGLYMLLHTIKTFFSKWQSFLLFFFSSSPLTTHFSNNDQKKV